VAAKDEGGREEMEEDRLNSDAWADVLLVPAATDVFFCRRSTRLPYTRNPGQKKGAGAAKPQTKHEPPATRTFACENRKVIV